jgi:hypothetical protein
MTDFTYANYESIFREALAADYQVITLRDFFEGEFDQGGKILVNRIDVDFRIDRVPKILAIFDKLGIAGSFFFRLHAPAYNLLSIGNIAIARAAVAAGNEVCLHTELKDVEGYCGIEPVGLLENELRLFDYVMGKKTWGTASHGDMTAYNNLDFWKQHEASEFGLLYEAYDPKLWQNCRYVSDSEWTRWKAYENGELMEGDRRNPIEHLRGGPRVLHLLTHPESWYDGYINE